MLAVLTTGCGATIKPRRVDADGLATAAITKAEERHVFDAQPDGIPGTKVRVRCPRAVLGADFSCTARLVLAGVTPDQDLTLASAPWRALVDRGGGVMVTRQRATISHFVQADRDRYCVLRLVEALNGDHTDPAAVTAALAPCEMAAGLGDLAAHHAAAPAVADPVTTEAAAPAPRACRNEFIGATDRAALSSLTGPPTKGSVFYAVCQSVEWAVGTVHDREEAYERVTGGRWTTSQLGSLPCEVTRLWRRADLQADCSAG